MSNYKKKKVNSKKEEKQADRIVKIVFFSLIALALAMMIGYSVFA